MPTETDRTRLRERLEQRREELVSLRESTHEELETMEEPEVEFEENAQKRFMAQGLERRGVQERDELEQVAAALGRLDAETYGVCTSCGQPIADARLDAIPWTPYCITCAEEEQAPPPPEALTSGAPQGSSRARKAPTEEAAQGREIHDDPWGVDRPEGTPMNPPDTLKPERSGPGPDRS